MCVLAGTNGREGIPFLSPVIGLDNELGWGDMTGNSTDDICCGDSVNDDCCKYVGLWRRGGVFIQAYSSLLFGREGEGDPGDRLLFSISARSCVAIRKCDDFSGEGQDTGEGQETGPD
jgi:hypothetical protein